MSLPPAAHRHCPAPGVIPAGREKEQRSELTFQGESSPGRHKFKCRFRGQKPLHMRVRSLGQLRVFSLRFAGKFSPAWHPFSQARASVFRSTGTRNRPAKPGGRSSANWGCNRRFRRSTQVRREPRSDQWEQSVGLVRERWKLTRATTYRWRAVNVGDELKREYFEEDGLPKNPEISGFEGYFP